MSDKICRRYSISGKVQGVWFRASTKETADRLGVTGWARNVEDGSVEVLACGTAEQLHQLHEWLKEGPERAHVKEITHEQIPWEDHMGFSVR